MKMFEEDKLVQLAEERRVHRNPPRWVLTRVGQASIITRIEAYDPDPPGGIKARPWRQDYGAALEQVKAIRDIGADYREPLSGQWFNDAAAERDAMYKIAITALGVPPGDDLTNPGDPLVQIRHLQMRIIEICARHELDANRYIVAGKS